MLGIEVIPWIYGGIYGGSIYEIGVRVRVRVRKRREEVRGMVLVIVVVRAFQCCNHSNISN